MNYNRLGSALPLHVHFLKSGSLASDMQWVELQSRMDDLPYVEHIAKRGYHRAEYNDDVFDLLNQRIGSAAKESSKSSPTLPADKPIKSSSSLPLRTCLDADDLTDEMRSQIDEQIRKDREEFASPITEHYDDFRVSTRSGENTFLRTGKASDFIRAQFKNNKAKLFSVSYHLNQTCDFSIVFYNSHDTSVLAKFWCHKMHFLFDIVKSRGKGHLFTPAELAGYQEPEEIDLILAHAPSKAFVDRVALIRAIAPR